MRVSVFQPHLGRFNIRMDNCTGRTAVIAFSAENTLMLVFNHLNPLVYNIKHINRAYGYAFFTLYAFPGIDRNLLKLFMYLLLAEQFEHQSFLRS